MKRNQVQQDSAIEDGSGIVGVTRERNEATAVLRLITERRRELNLCEK